MTSPLPPDMTAAIDQHLAAAKDDVRSFVAAAREGLAAGDDETVVLVVLRRRLRAEGPAISAVIAATAIMMLAQEDACPRT